MRVAEDAVVPDLLSGGRLELGVGNGGNPAAFAGFELDGHMTSIATPRGKSAG